MERVMNIIKPKPDPKQLLRDWQRKLCQECRNIERQIRGYPNGSFTELVVTLYKVSDLKFFP